MLTLRRGGARLLDLLDLKVAHAQAAQESIGYCGMRLAPVRIDGVLTSPFCDGSLAPRLKRNSRSVPRRSRV